MVGRMPPTRSLGLSLARTRSTLRWSCCIPFMPKYSHCSGMITSSAATKALMVIRLSAGGQLLLEQALAADLVEELGLGAGELDVGGQVVEASVLVLEHDVAHGDFGVDQQVVDRLL